MTRTIRTRLGRATIFISLLALAWAISWLSGDPRVDSVEAADPAAVLEKGASASEAALGLEMGTLHETGLRPTTQNAKVFQWADGEVEIDKSTGQVRTIIQRPSTGSQIGSSLEGDALKERAARTLTLLGYDPSQLKASGYSEGTAVLEERGDFTVYQKQWKKVSSAGYWTGGLIDLEMNGVDGKVTRFLATEGPVVPEPEPSLGLTAEKAVDLAKREATRMTDLPLQLDDVFLMYNDKGPVTGGTLKLVFIVTLKGTDPATGVIIASKTVIDAATGDVIKSTGN